MNHSSPEITLCASRSSTPVAVRTPGRYTMPTPSFRTPARSLLRPSTSSSLSRFSTGCERGGDRFIPSRSTTNLNMCRRSLLAAMNGGGDYKEADECCRSFVPRTAAAAVDFNRNMMCTIANIPIDELTEEVEPRALFRYTDTNAKSSSSGSAVPLCDPFTLQGLRYTLPREQKQQISEKKVLRKFASRPSRVLDAPGSRDDFYCNLISWSKNGVVALALANDVYTWNAATSDANLVFSLPANEWVTSVSWAIAESETSQLAIGTNLGKLFVVDATSGRVSRALGRANRAEVSALSWTCNGCLSSGGRNNYVLNFDPRVGRAVVSRYGGFQSRACGLSWNSDGTTLAGGFNESNIYLWDSRISNQQADDIDDFSSHLPRVVLQGHKAAVKALGWCPSNRGWLASGGGYGDGTIKLWNACNGNLLSSTETENQVTSLVWTHNGKELLTSHGSATSRKLVLWKSSSNCTFDLLHDFERANDYDARILSMAGSPDGSQVATIGNAENLVIWNIDHENSARRRLRSTLGDLDLFSPVIR